MYHQPVWGKSVSIERVKGYLYFTEVYYGEPEEPKQDYPYGNIMPVGCCIHAFPCKIGRYLFGLS